MDAVSLRTGVTFEQHRDDICVDDCRIHLGGTEPAPSRRHSRSIAANSSTDSSSAEACPRRSSKSVTGWMLWEAASSSNAGLRDLLSDVLVVSLSTFSAYQHGST